MLDAGAPVALAVDSVEALVAIAADRIEVRESELSAQPGRAAPRRVSLGAAATRSRRYSTSRGCSEPRLRSSARGRRDRRARAEPPATTQRPATSASAASMLVTFEVAGQEFALELAAVQEILPAPAVVVAVPRAEALVARGDLVARPPAAAAVVARAARLSARAGRGWTRESRRHESRRRAGGARRGSRASDLGRAGRRPSTRFRRFSRRAPAAKRASRPSIAARKVAG